MRRLSVRMPRIIISAAILFVVTAVSVGCGDDGGGDSDSIIIPRRDQGAITLDAGARDLGPVPDGIPFSDEGPAIEIVSPTEEQIVVGTVLRVVARITDPEGIDAQSVTLTLDMQGQEPIPLGLSDQQDTYEALIDMADISGQARFYVTAADLLGTENTAVRIFERDPGPVVEFRSPAADSRHRSSVSLQIVVADLNEITDFAVRVGSQELAVDEVASDGQQTVYVGTIAFDDPAFGLPLSGKQVLTATAVNANGAKTTVQRVFYVDDKGPTISITSQAPGDLVGGIVAVSAEITDPAGVLTSSVQCVVGNELENRVVTLVLNPQKSGVYEGQFDTRTLSDEQLWPVMSFRAADKLGNESHKDIEVGLDNGPPVLSLDPPENFTAMRIVEDRLECSKPFDPVGGDAASDTDRVPQVTKIRVRIEDQGNFVPGTWKPISGVDGDTTWLYVLPAGVNKPLVIDTDGDGWCDSINSEVIPLGSAASADQAIAVNISAVPSGGMADYYLPDYYNPYDEPVLDLRNPFCQALGSADQPPSPLCDITPLTIAIFYTSSSSPAIWGIPPIAGDPLKCLGLPFDFRANEVPTRSWTCIAATARDGLGNVGVSRPMRLYVDYGATGNTADAPGTPPSCTGTLDSTTGTVTNTACYFREPFNPSVENSTDSCQGDADCCSDNPVTGSCGRFLGRCMTSGECERKWPQEFPEWETRFQ